MTVSNADMMLTMSEQSAAARRPSLRDRQRAAIGTELRYAAYRLFTDRGYDEVSIEDIAAAAALSRRTFFRHVASKEALLLEPLHRGGAAIARFLEAAPVRQSPDRALAAAIVSRAAAFEDTETQDWRAAMLSAPDVLDKATIVSPADRDRITKIIAARMDTDAGDDPRPGLLVHLAFAASDYGFQQWIQQSDSGTRDLREWVEDSLKAIIHRRWRPTP